MTNRDVDYAREYHQLSKNSPESVSPRRVSPELIPRNHKLYLNRPSIPLPPPKPSEAALTALNGLAPSDGALLDLPTLSSLLRFSAGIVRRSQIGDTTFEFRAAACTGACYHIDLYVITGDLEGLNAGVYHYGVHNDTLVALRQGDFRSAFIDATCSAEPASNPEAFIVFTSTFWRNAWRYEDRAYRHAFWDSGTIVANLLALASAYGLDAALLLGFVDRDVNTLIDVDGAHEAALGIIALAHASSPASRTSSPVSTLDLPTAPLSAFQIEYPSIQRLHDASALRDCAAVERWRRTDSQKIGPSTLTMPPPMPGGSPEAVIERRGSARRFNREPISRTHLASILHAATLPLDADFLVNATDSLLQPYLIVHAVAGLRPGVYRYESNQREPLLVKAGEVRDQARHLALDQQPAAEAAVNIYFMTDLHDALDRFGNRGYRAAQLEGGIRGGRVYLAAYALGLRATGLTFFDDEVSRFFDAPDLSPMFLVAAGR